MRRHPMKKGSIVLIALVLALGALSSAHAGYTYTPLNYPGASDTGASTISNGGTILCGYVDASGVAHGLSLSGGTYTSLDYPGASSTDAYGINDGGTIVGGYTDKDDGITTATGTYGVNEIVTRDQMAAFLARAFLGMH